MNVTTITASHGRTISTGNAERARYEVQLAAQLIDGEDPVAARVDLCRQARAAVAAWIAADLILDAAPETSTSTAPEPTPEAMAPAALDTVATTRPDPLGIGVPQRGVSPIQLNRLYELYSDLHPEEDFEAGVPARFQAEFGHSIQEGTYVEARQLTATLLQEKRVQQAAPPLPASAYTEATDALSLVDTTALARRQVRTILDQLTLTQARATQRVTGVTLTKLHNAIRSRDWPEPAQQLPRLMQELLERNPTERAPVQEGEARALLAWLSDDATLPMMDILWPREEEVA